MKKKNILKYNRLLAAVLVLVFMLGSLLVLDTDVYAQNLLIQLSRNSVKEGDELTVSVMVPAGASVNVSLNYDPEIFSYRSSEGTVDEKKGTVSADISAGASRATFDVTFQAIAAGRGSFAVSSSDSANIRGASVVVPVEENPDAVIIQTPSDENAGDSEVDNTQKEGDGQPEKQTWYELDGEKLYPSMQIPASDIPEGFTEDKITLWGREYPCLCRENSADTALVYLVDENHSNGAFYMIAKDRPEEVFFVCLDYHAYKSMKESAKQDLATAGGEKDKKEDMDALKSQNRLLLYAFIVVVLILLIVIVVLMTARRQPEEEPAGRPVKKPVPKPVQKPVSKPAAGPASKPEKKPEKAKTQKQEKKKTGFWDAMFAGINDDIAFDDFDDEKPEPETVKKESVKRGTEKKERTEKPEKKTETRKTGNPGEKKKTDEDIEFIDL